MVSAAGIAPPASPPPSSAAAAPAPQESSSSWLLQKFQEYVPQAGSQYKAYEDAFVKKIKDELIDASEKPAVLFGVAVAAGLLMRGPRRFLLRHTLGRFQSEEARFIKVERGLKDLGESIANLNKDKKRLIASTDIGGENMRRGHAKIKATGKEIQRLVKSIYKIESQAADLMDGLRALPGRDALKLRAEVASMASSLKEKRQELNQRILKISELGVRV